MFLIVGLGNPGKKYRETRHNVGFKTVDKLCEKRDFLLNKSKINSIYGEFKMLTEKVIVMKPLTYMNNSGVAVAEMSKYFKIAPQNIIVVYDDVDLSVGKLRIRPSGSAGTHNGMKSIIYHLQTDDFPRVRIGIGKNQTLDLANYVLQRFDPSETSDIEKIIDLAVESMEEIILTGVDVAMNKYNIR
jgi:PTH1 family peptidyl-tRNA hydrolase